MMDVTDRHTRWLYRAISRHVLLYTEMVTAHALDKGDAARLLAYEPVEHPIALQLGGDDPLLLAQAARMGAEAGYDEINLNVGCPSPRVQSGNFGACLMLTPQVVADAVAAMRAVVEVPVTVKCRIGVDDQEGPESLRAFADAVVAAGAERLTVHARKAWLKGLSPKQNRNVPPLRYEVVHALAADLPDVVMEINGGIRSLDAIDTHLEHVDAVMIGRGIWHDPYLLAEVDRRYFGATEAPPSREEVVHRWIPYVEAQIAAGHKAQYVVRHGGALFAGQPGVKAWKRALARVGSDGVSAILDGLAAVRETASRHREHLAASAK